MEYNLTLDITITPLHHAPYSTNENDDKISAVWNDNLINNCYDHDLLMYGLKARSKVYF